MHGHWHDMPYVQCWRSDDLRKEEVHAQQVMHRHLLEFRGRPELV